MLVERFIEYAKIYTTSDPHSDTFPSSDRQLNLANLLLQQLKSLGLEDAKIDKYGYVTASLKSNCSKTIPTLGLLAHMDTAPDMSGENVNPKIIENYDGNEIVLNEAENIIMSPEVFPSLNDVIGLDLIVTDGTTLLGADDKAGIAIIMETVEYLTTHPEIEHGTIKIAFTPDEEVGHGVDYFDIENFGADIALTLDGSKLGEIQYECFNAFSANVEIAGESVHTGSAKNKMINSISLAMELDRMLPEQKRPQYTEGYEGFFHLDEISGSVENTKMEYILRDFDYAEILNMVDLFQNAVDFLNSKYGERISVKFTESYRNMKEKIEPKIDFINMLVSTLESMDITPVIEPIRGGTDGSRLSWKGLPTPNIFTGGMNFHGKYEYIPVQHMEKSIEFLLKVIENM